MSYRRVPRKAIRYTEATRPEATTQLVQPIGLDALSYREIQERAIELGINGKQTREALVKAIQEAQDA